ncbi:MAG: hypothetical protein IT303_06835 [Dehalococcoidia bacterium]|nr:hypothetical protein [Dehalococcoidia bacterium]
MTQVVMCPRDPGVETALRCGRCDTPICPKCMVAGPAGQRCKDCGKAMRNPIYTLGTQHIIRAAAAAAIGGVAMGLAWGFILLPFSVGLFSIFLGAGLAWAFTRVMDFATGRKRGPIVVGFAIAGIGIAWGTQAAIVGLDVARFGLLAVAIGAYLAYQNLRSF